MARKSKLTDSQWEEIRRRVLNGESQRAIAKAYGISESALRGKISAQVVQIKTVAEQIVNTEKALAGLPISAQISARGLADRLHAISNDLAAAAGYGAATAHRLAGIAFMKASEVDDASPISDEASLEAIKGIAALTRTANESAYLGIELLKANKGLSDPAKEEEEGRRQGYLVAPDVVESNELWAQQAQSLQTK